MRIGIASPIDIRSFLKYFGNDENKRVIEENYLPFAASAVSTLSHSFIEMKHTVIIFTLAPSNFTLHSKDGRLTIHGIKQYDTYPIKYLWADFINSKSLQKRISNFVKELDILHAHWTYTFGYASSQFINILPVFCTVRDWASYIWRIESFKNKITWSFRWFMNELVFRKKGVHFIANSPYTASLIKSKYKIDVPIIPNPIDESFLKKDEYFASGTLSLLCVSSSNDKRKNVQVLLESFQILLLKYPTATLTIVGGAFIEDNSTIRFWRSRGLFQNVIFPGFITHEQLISYYDKASIFVTPSLEETFGNTVIEAIARKVPVIAGVNSGALPYVLDNGKAGFLCDVRNPIKLATQIEYVHLNPYDVNLKVKYAFNMLENLFTSRKVADIHLKYFSDFF